MNLKDMLNQMLGEAGFLEKAAFAGSTDPDDKQMVAIANRVAQSTLEFYNWSSLIKNYTIKIVADPSDPDQAQIAYPLPADFSNMVADSAWEVDGSRRVDLPTPQGRWYMYKFSAWSDGGTIRARIMYPNIEIYSPQIGDEFQFAYESKYPVISVDGTPKQYFTQDDDSFALEDELLIKGTLAKWGQTKMMPQAGEWKMEYMQDMNSAIGRDAGGRTVGGANRESRYDCRSPYTPLYLP
jgi:hypothetical protein